VAGRGAIAMRRVGALRYGDAAGGGALELVVVV